MPRRSTHGYPSDAPGSIGSPPAGSASLVPSRRQYLELKAQYPNAILLYRLGDFYETFDDDAKIVARDARITLTSRSFGRNGRVPMAGIPHHALNYYLGRLLAAGHTVAIAEQLSEPGRGLVHRAVTRVLTPGTVAEPGLLPATENRYLAAIAPRGDRIGLAWVDVSTGEFATTELAGAATVRLQEELARLNPAECLVPDRMDPPGQSPMSPNGLHLTGSAGSPTTGIQEALAVSPPASSHVTRLESWHFDPQRAAAALCERFGVRSLIPFGCAELPAAIGAAGAILAYVERTNPRLLPLLVSLRTERADHHVGLDAATRRNLELTRSHRTGGTRGSLLGVLDLTRTPQGARYLRRLIGQPLRDLAELRRRQAIIAALVAAPHLRPHLGELLVQIGDVERVTGRVIQGQASAREFLTLAASLRAIPAVASCLQATENEALTTFASKLDAVDDLLHVLDAAVEEDDSGAARIRPGFSERLDAAIEAVQATRSWLAGLERHERERTGIRSLKVGYNKVFGYYIEVTRPNLHLVPEEYVRKQTVATGERYVTAALKDAEARLLAAGEEIAALERDVLACLSQRVASTAARLLRTAERLAELDAFLSLAEVAARNTWTLPILEESEELVITGGRHPVVEASLEGEPFIPNDCHLGGDAPRVLLVTGPNMGGKSTYLRQVALIVLLAQIGSFVPAASARIGLVDRIFTRVGAHDDLAGGASTFMVEMMETATILHQATRKSLLILDEIGRGTSTNDGLAIARAVLEDIHHRVCARTLFATHFLELTALAEDLSSLANVHVAATETDGQIVFLYAVRPGCADRAYGIHVARLAGLPRWVADRAEQVLNELPAISPVRSMGPAAATPHSNGVCGEPVASEPSQLTLQGFPPPLSASRLARELKRLDLSAMTPKQALDWLFEQQARL